MPKYKYTIVVEGDDVAYYEIDEEGNEVPPIEGRREELERNLEHFRIVTIHNVIEADVHRMRESK